MEKTKNSFKLIEGNFTPAEASKVIFALINSKINYHSMDAFNNEISYQKQVTGSMKRIEELKATNKAIRALLNLAADNGLQVQVNSSIEISFVKG
jgi:hypothetical protein